MKIIREKEPKFENVAIVLESKEEVNLLFDALSFVNDAHFGCHGVIKYKEGKPTFYIGYDENQMAIKIVNKLSEFI